MLLSTIAVPSLFLWHCHVIIGDSLPFSWTNAQEKLLNIGCCCNTSRRCAKYVLQGVCSLKQQSIQAETHKFSQRFPRFVLRWLGSSVLPLSYLWHSILCQAGTITSQHILYQVIVSSCKLISPLQTKPFLSRWKKPESHRNVTMPRNWRLWTIARECGNPVHT